MEETWIVYRGFEGSVKETLWFVLDISSGNVTGGLIVSTLLSNT